MAPEASLTVCRFAHDTAAMLLWGSFADLAFLMPAALGEETARRLNVFRWGSLIVNALATAAALPIAVASIGNGWSDVGNPAAVEAVLFETSVGTAWMAQAVLSLVLIALSLRPCRSIMLATATVAGLQLASLALTGHAVMDEGALGILHRIADIVHVLAAGAWVGALVPLLATLKMIDDPISRVEAGVALRRFSIAGHGAVALVIATGAANTALVLRRWPTDWSSPYQELLLAKIALVVVMTVLALANRYLLVPRLGTARADAIRGLHSGTWAEIALGLAVIGCVSAFGRWEPA